MDQRHATPPRRAVELSQEKVVPQDSVSYVFFPFFFCTHRYSALPVSVSIVVLLLERYKTCGHKLRDRLIDNIVQHLFVFFGGCMNCYSYDICVCRSWFACFFSLGYSCAPE